MRRREFISLLGGAAAWPLVANAQQSERMRRIGVLGVLDNDDPEAKARVAVPPALSLIAYYIVDKNRVILTWPHWSYIVRPGRPRLHQRTGEGR